MANARDADVFAIGNARADKFTLRSGRLRKATAGGASTLDLRDDAHADHASTFKPQARRIVFS
jgi:hypothetical protein